MRSLVDDRIEGDVGGDMPLRSSSCKPEVGPPRNPLGRLRRIHVSGGPDVYVIRRCVSAGNGFSIILTTNSSCFSVILSVTLHTRSECLNAVRRLSSWVGLRLSKLLISMAIGN